MSHKLSNSSTISAQRPTYEGTSSANEERSRPEQRPRWKPTPEQIRILKSRFDSGMEKPSIDDITRLTAQLQQFGQVGEANVFYWFRNRRSRSKQTQRHLQPVNEGTGENSIDGQLINILVNRIPVKVPVGAIKVRAFFGENALLLHSTGQPVSVNQLGFTLEGLQPGAEYYVLYFGIPTIRISIV